MDRNNARDCCKVSKGALSLPVTYFSDTGSGSGRVLVTGWAYSFSFPDRASEDSYSKLKGGID